MGEVAERYGRVADGFTARLDGVPAGAWSDPTPCTDWTVTDLVGHVIGVHRRIVASLDDTEAAEVDPAGDLGRQWREASGAVRAALGDERAEATTSGMFGEQSFESLVGRLLCSDTLLHTWDLARATDQDEHLDPAAVRAAREMLDPLDEALRRPGGFAPKLEPPAGADEQAELLGFSGRAA
ncbi:MAG TPA: TIGR03086 family metal-binding protein [Acidimicrobiales bacterium]|nr:TIGR03086 family metal-binding protein [Acidimicrobiales bacterium]